MTTHQATAPCPSCGSWYRDVDMCNVCGKICNDPPEKEIRYVSRSTGRIWSKKYHRYLTGAEIKAGEKGG